MESLNQCHCCLQRPSERDLRTPYTLLGITEIYSVMLEECFAMRLTPCHDGKSGICEVCLGRLREACQFKMQVQHCQAELQERLEGGLSVKDEEALEELPEDGPCSESPEPSLPSDEEPPGPLPEDEPLDHYPLHVSVASAGEYGVSTAPLSSRAKEQLALACSVRLERLRDSPRASQPCPVTSHREPSPASIVKDEPGDTIAEEQAYMSDLESSIKSEPNDDDVGDEQLLDVSCTPAIELRRRLSTSSTMRLEACPVTSHHEPTAARSVTLPDDTRQQAHTHQPTLNNQHTDTNAMYSCKICSQKFSNKTLFDRHAHTQMELETYICDMCNMKFRQKSDLIRHIFTIHMKINHVCKIYNKKFEIMNSLKKHQRLHTGDIPYKCTVCEKKFVLVSSLNLDQGIHTIEKRYKCEECHKQFKYRNGLNKHKKIHTGDKRFSCDQCGKRFLENSTLTIHKRVHTGEKLYKCDECNELFGYLNSFKRHIKKHARGDIYSCNICDEKFPIKNLLAKHKKKHIGEKAYHCEECNKRFNRKDYLDTHKITHNGDRPYICDRCGKRFKRKHNLDQHKKNHAEKSHNCSICNKQFTHKHQLDAHKITHTKEKAYICEKCGARFAQNYILQKHKQIHVEKVLGDGVTVSKITKGKISKD
ncbi:zinc finger protein 723-like [Cydia strobilella]|uniref:zinc finger protein 723-like n=1 Tax=Cydia strobilella TaxID=1100964 RepID=UPI003003CCA1